MWRILRPQDNQLGIRANRIVTYWLWLIAAPLSVLLIGVPAWCVFRWRYAKRGMVIRRLPSERLGHFLAETDMAVCSHLSQRDPAQSRVEICYFSSAVTPNRHVAKQARTHLRIVPTYIGWNLDVANHLLTLRGTRQPTTPIHGRADLRFLSTSDRWFRIEEDTERRKADLYQDLRIPRDARIVPVFLRDSFYESSIGLSSTTDQHQHRNSSRQSFSLAVDRLCLSGFTPVFMGRTDPGGAPTSSRFCEVDYSASSRASPEADLCLVSDCSFAIAGDSGSAFLPLLFRQTTAFVNVGSLFGLPRRGPIAMVCLKHFFDADTGRELTFRELVDRQVSQMSLMSEFEAARIRVLDCSPEEIEAVVIDMVAFIERAGSAPIGSTTWCASQQELTVPLLDDDWPRASKSWSLLRPDFCRT